MHVVFMGDLARGEQARNVSVTHDLMSPIFRRIGLETRIHTSRINHIHDRAKWFDEWKRSLDSGDTSELDKVDLTNAVVFGFELSSPMIEALNARGVRWVNAYIHPVRFGEDLFFHFEISFPADLSRSFGSETGLFLAANQISQSVDRHAALNDARKTLLILGQDPQDRSVYFDGKFRDLLSYEGEVKSLAEGFDRVLYKPHIAVTEPELDQKILRTFNAEPVDEPNYYRFLAKNRIDLCCAISSSTIHQAKYFGTDAKFLEPRAKKFGPIIDYQRTLSDGAFWAGQFVQMPEAIDTLVKDKVKVRPNLLRSQYTSWGYFSPNPDFSQLETQFAQLRRDVSALHAGLTKLGKRRYLSRLWRGIRGTWRKG